MLKVDIAEEKDIKILTLSGEFDLSEKQRGMELSSEVTSDSPKGDIIDLTDITFLDSAGIEVLVSFHERLRGTDARLGLVIDANDYIISKFRRLGFFKGTNFEFYKTRDEAIAAQLDQQQREGQD